MDAENVLKSEIFKPIVVTLAPGLLVLSPYFFVGLYFQPGLLDAIKKYEIPTLSTAFALIVIAGYMLENIGSRIEYYFWTAHKNSTDDDKWYSYLLSKPDPNQLIGPYIASIVLRMKLENSLAAAFAFVWLGLTWLYRLDVIQETCTYWLSSAAVWALCIYQLFESRASVILLLDLRRRM